MTHQQQAVKSGFWPLYRFRPTEGEHGHPFQLDSHKPTIPVRDFALEEARWSMLARSDPERSEHLLALAQADAEERWRFYEQLAGVERTLPHLDGEAGEAGETREAVEASASETEEAP
jgi:pyruvate-ferredoxin/flavodoxin oxidoreductase